MNYVWAGLIGFVFGGATFWWGFHTGQKEYEHEQNDAFDYSHSYRSYSGYHYARSPNGSIWVKIT